jgi:hypothetical protein
MKVGRAPGDRDLTGVDARADLRRLKLDDRGRAIHLDPTLRRISRRGGLVAQSRGGAGHQAQPEGSFSSQVNINRRDAVRVIAAADPGPPAILGDPQLQGGRSVRPRVVDGILKLEPCAGDQQCTAAIAAGRLNGIGFRHRSGGNPGVRCADRVPWIVAVGRREKVGRRALGTRRGWRSRLAHCFLGRTGA